MSATSILTAARERISDVSRWTQLAAARDVNGREAHHSRANACQWSIWGAVFAEMNIQNHFKTRTNDCVVDAARELYGRYAEDVNDYLGHAAVLRVLDRAIELSKEGK